MLKEYCNKNFHKELFPIHNSYHCPKKEIKHIILNELFPDTDYRKIKRDLVDDA